MPTIEGATTRAGTSAVDAVAAEVVSLAGAIPAPAVADLGASSNQPAYTAHTGLSTPADHTATSAIAATYASLAEARTSVDAFRSDVEDALAELDGNITTAAAETETALDGIDTYLAAQRTVIETRLDAIEAKVNAALAMLRTAGILAS